MYAPLRWTLLPLAVAACLAATAAQAGAAHPLTVQDEAGMFSRSALSRANQTIADIKRRNNKDVLVETRASPPAGFDEANKRGKRAVRQFYARWADGRAATARVSIFIGIVRSPGHEVVAVADPLRRSGAFTNANRDELDAILLKHLEDERDQALLDGLEYVQRSLDEHGGSTTPRAQAPAPANPRAGERDQDGLPRPGGWSIGGILCFAIVAIAVIWVIFGIIRAVTGMGRRMYGGGPGGPGYGGPGYGGGYYGGGGGGFFSSLMGGMFGAAAGSWLYNSVFGGGSNWGHGGGWSSSSGGPDPSAGVDTGPQDDGGYSSSGGGDFDDGGGAGGGDFGGDTGGGGGDVGGGGDFGGGDF